MPRSGVFGVLVLMAIVVMADPVCAGGKQIYEEVCSKCHRSGVLKAPVAGNKDMWEPRVKFGKERLYSSAIMGKGDMPPRGGSDRLSDDDLKAAVDYLVSLAER